MEKSGPTTSAWLSAGGTGADVETDLGFTTLVSNLDNAASEIVAYQRDSTVQRKDLAQKTKDFRKMDDAAKLAEFKSLLKGIYSHIGPRLGEAPG